MANATVEVGAMIMSNGSGGMAVGDTFTIDLTEAMKPPEPPVVELHDNGVSFRLRDAYGGVTDWMTPIVEEWEDV